MDVQFQLSLPLRGWDYLPVPNVAASTSEQYELIIKFQLPAFVAKLFGVDVTTDPTKSTFDRYVFSPESPFVLEAHRLIEEGLFTLCKEGIGGTYLVNQPDGSIMGIFKPAGVLFFFRLLTRP